jgi:hypothetical protein
MGVYMDMISNRENSKQGYVELNIDTLRELKHLYDTAIAEGMDKFMYHDMVLLTMYAKYLIQYGEMILNRQHSEVARN